MTFEQIVAYMTGDGWPVERLGPGTFRSGFRGERRSFPFFVHVDDSFVSLAAVPYVRLPMDESRAARLMDRLLHLNREMNLAKFSVDDDGDVVLSVEYPVADLDESEVRDALDVVTFYADRYWAELDAIASGTASP